MRDFNVTIGNVIASTDMIEEDVVRFHMGLEPKSQCFTHQSSPNEDYFEETNDYLDGTMSI